MASCSQDPGLLSSTALPFLGWDPRPHGPVCGASFSQHARSASRSTPAWSHGHSKLPTGLGNVILKSLGDDGSSEKAQPLLLSSKGRMDTGKQLSVAARPSTARVSPTSPEDFGAGFPLTLPSSWETSASVSMRPSLCRQSVQPRLPTATAWASSSYL